MRMIEKAVKDGTWGRATELSLGHIMDANTWESLRGNAHFTVSFFRTRAQNNILSKQTKLLCWTGPTNTGYSPPAFIDDVLVA